MTQPASREASAKQPAGQPTPRQEWATAEGRAKWLRETRPVGLFAAADVCDLFAYIDKLERENAQAPAMLALLRDIEADNLMNCEACQACEHTDCILRRRLAALLATLDGGA